MEKPKRDPSLWKTWVITATLTFITLMINVAHFLSIKPNDPTNPAVLLLLIITQAIGTVMATFLAINFKRNLPKRKRKIKTELE